MSLLLFSLFACFLTIISETLPEYRQSCKYKHILIESSSYEPKEHIIMWEIPEDWKPVFQHECTEAAKLLRNSRSLRETLPRGIVYEGLLKDKRQRPIENLDDIGEALRSFLKATKNSIAHPFILDKLSEEVAKEVPEYPQSYIRLLLKERVYSATCFTNQTIRVVLQLMTPDELRIRKCEDIGRTSNNTYEFYNLSPVWIAKDEDGNTIKINTNECQLNKLGKLLCPTSSKIYYNATCHINNVDSCSKTYVQPEKLIGSFSRSLPNGIAVYGTFNTLTLDFKKEPKNSFSTHPRLYYFSFQNFIIATTPIIPNSAISTLKA